MAKRGIKRSQRLRYNGAEKEVVCFSGGGKLHGRRMDARPCLSPRLAATTPSGLPPGVSPHDRTLSQLGEEMAQAAHAIRDLHDPSVLCSRSRAHHACTGYLGYPFLERKK